MRRTPIYLALTLAACSPAEPLGPPMQLEEVQVSLVTEEAFREVLAEQAQAPVVGGTFSPRTDSTDDSGPLPALAMVPAARVLLRIGKLDATHRLEFAAGFDRSAYEGEDSGLVRFSLRAGGRALFETELPFGPGTAKEQRAWQRSSLELEGVEEFELSTELVAGAGLPVACFAGLEIVMRGERPRERASAEAPNVVLIVVDTLRYDRLGCYGNERGLTPNIDALAQRGVTFDNAYAAAPWTWPSTASILTGLTSAEHGVLSHQACYLADSLDTLPEALQRAGWSTGGFSANPLISASKAFDQGFEEFSSYEWNHAPEVIDDALAWLETRAEWRFLLYLQLVDPHDYKPSEDLRARFAGPAPEGFTRSATRGLLGQKVRGQEYDVQKLERYSAYLGRLYDACVAEVDREIGRLVAALEAQGRLDHTLIVVTSDHGEEFLDHGLLYHGSQLHRELVGIPLVLAGPGLPRGEHVATRVENRHLAPTLLAHLELEAPGNLAGVDLLDGRAAAEAAREPAFVTTSQGIWKRSEGPDWPNLTMHGVLLGAEFFIWLPEGPDGSTGMAYFDLASDPTAQRDVSAEHPERCANLQTLIERWLERSERTRPNVLDGGEAALEMLRKLGYVDR